MITMPQSLHFVKFSISTIQSKYNNREADLSSCILIINLHSQPAETTCTCNVREQKILFWLISIRFGSFNVLAISFPKGGPWATIVGELGTLHLENEKRLVTSCHFHD